jgi:hypothetical protein
MALERYVRLGCRPNSMLVVGSDVRCHPSRTTKKEVLVYPLELPLVERVGYEAEQTRSAAICGLGNRRRDIGD